MTAVEAPSTHWAGEPVRVLRESWGVPHVEAWERIGSTNDRLGELAGDGVPAFTVVVAEEQTAGRGRGGASWVSPPGVGIWMSVLVEAPAGGRAPLVPLLAGVAVARALERWVPGLGGRIKWPNDVLVGDRKLTGILCEGAPGGKTLVGIGINVGGNRDDFPARLRETVTTVEAEAGAAPPRPALAGAVVGELRELASPAPDVLDDDLVGEIASLDVLRGRRVATSTGTVGRSAGIDRSGALLVDPGEGESPDRVVAGSVRLI